MYYLNLKTTRKYHLWAQIDNLVHKVVTGGGGGGVLSQFLHPWTIKIKDLENKSPTIVFYLNLKPMVIIIIFIRKYSFVWQHHGRSRGSVMSSYLSSYFKLTLQVEDMEGPCELFLWKVEVITVCVWSNIMTNHTWNHGNFFAWTVHQKLVKSPTALLNWNSWEWPS